MNYEDVNFNNIPNFQFKEYLTDKIEGYSISSLFEIFKGKDDEILFASPFFDIKNPTYNQYYISLISLKDNQEKKKLYGNIGRTRVIRYFWNEKTSKGYLACADRKGKITIWDSNNDYQIMYEQTTDMKCYINDILMLFIDNQIYLAICSNNTYYTKVINIHNKNEIDINNSLDIDIFNLSYWYNTINKTNYKHHLLFYEIYMGQRVNLLMVHYSMFEK